MMKKRLSLCLAMLLTLLFAACTGGAGNTAASGGASTGTAASGGGQEGKVWRFAIVFNGPVNDGGWNQNAWKGLENIKEKYGDSVEITYAEKVDQADYEDTFYGYAKDGYDMVFANGFEFSEAALRVADEFPEVFFGIINGLEYRDNVCGLEFDNVELGYICGLAAGAQSAEMSGKIAFIGTEAIPSFRNFYAGFVFGAQQMNPSAECKDFYTGDWSDVTKATEMANAAIGSGYDILVPWAGAINHAVYKVCEDEGVMFVQTSMQMEPDKFRDSIIINTDQSNAALISAGAEACMNGEFPANGSITGNLDNGINIINRWGETTSEDVKSKVDAAYEELRAGNVTLPEKVTE